MQNRTLGADGIYLGYGLVVLQSPQGRISRLSRLSRREAPSQEAGRALVGGPPRG